MPKLKTHKGLAKVCKVRPGGTVKLGVAGTNHNTGKHTSANKRNKRKGNALSTSDYKRVKAILGK